ncbi:MAG: glycoside hydrolase family 19 protein [Methylococcales bacterium]
MADLTIHQLYNIMPNGKSRIDPFVDPLNAAMREFGITTPERQREFIAQIAHESGEFKYVEEIASGSAYNDRADLGNTQPEAVSVAKANGSTAGKWFKGHGLIQVTGYTNHKACGTALKLDAINKPTLLTTPDGASRSAAWFWGTHGCNELADKKDFIGVTKRINGGTNGLADRQKFYERAKEQ